MLDDEAERDPEVERLACMFEQKDRTRNMAPTTGLAVLA